MGFLTTFGNPSPFGILFFLPSSFPALVWSSSLNRTMAQQGPTSQSAEHFDYVLFEDPKHLKYTDDQIDPWIDPNVLKLTHRIGRGPFGDVWIATHHISTEDYDEYHEVAIKMLPIIKEDQEETVLAKFREVFYKCQGLPGVCFLYGITIKNGNVCIAMKFYEGSVGDKMAHLKGGKLQVSDVLRYGADLAQAILELHSRGVLVLNLKPCNFLLSEHDQAVLGDFGIPSLLYGISLQSSDLVKRLGTPNYMAPEQWQPDVRGPISYETDSWGFGCSIVEMLSGVQPWSGRLPNEIYQLVVTKQEKPNIPSSLPAAIENILHGCFEYDLRNRPLMGDVLHAFKSCKDIDYDDRGAVADRNKTVYTGFSDWSLLKDLLEVGDTVRSRKSSNSCKPENMEIPEGNVVGLENQDGCVLVRVHGIHDPQGVHSSTLERVTYGFAAGDWVRIKAEGKKFSPIGILHSINRDGRVSAGFIGMETLWKGNFSELQMAKPYCVGQFVRLKANISKPRFEWPCKNGGQRGTGRISQILPNGCLVVNFPGRFVFGEAGNFLADPAEVDAVSFSTCEGVVKKYQHLEDFHWAVRPLLIALGLFTALKMGLFVGKSMGGSRKKAQSSSSQVDRQQQDGGQNAAWLPPNVANILFREGNAPSTR